LSAALSRGSVAVRQRLRLAREQVGGRALQLEALSPERTLERGYAICTVDSQTVLRSIYQVGVGQQLDIRVIDGTVSGDATGRQAIDGRPGSSDRRAEPNSRKEAAGVNRHGD
jgi:exodeoxyribonuclease VII large subunit